MKLPELKKDYLLGVFIMMIFFLLIACVAFADDISLYAIEEIESSGNPDACSFAGCQYGRGLYQISEIALEDWNNYHPNEQYKIKQLFNPDTNERIANWMFFVRIPKMLRYYKIEETTITVLASYNWGIGNVVKWYRDGGSFESLPKETRNYINKYERLTNAKR